MNGQSNNFNNNEFQKQQQLMHTAFSLHHHGPTSIPSESTDAEADSKPDMAERVYRVLVTVSNLITR